ncbi:MAG: DinB family protein [Azospirillaceae bacterium]|nr:DinB family protein [Azospirillaceae bacterium]
MDPRQIVLLAQYNSWMNAKLFEAAARLPAAELAADRGAFFRSLLGTLNHLLVVDLLWLRRFREHPPGYPALDPVLELPRPDRLDQILYRELDGLAEARRRMDQAMEAWAATLPAEVLDQTLRFTSYRGDAYAKRFGDIVLHLFNHQTHHRGQATTLLSQAGQDVGATDLSALIPDEA